MTRLLPYWHLNASPLELLANELQDRIDSALAVLRERSTVEYRWVATGITAQVSTQNCMLATFPLVVDHRAVSAIHTPVWSRGYGVRLSPELGMMLMRRWQPLHHVPVTILAPISPIDYVTGLQRFIDHHQLSSDTVEKLLEEFTYRDIDEIVNGPREHAETRW